MTSKKSLLIGFALIGSIAAAEKNNVILEITNVKKAEGNILISVSNSKETFKSKEGGFIKAFIKAKKGTNQYEFELEDGEYAFSLFHDLNENDSLDAGIFGIPKEPYTFSKMKKKSIPKDFNFHKVKIYGSTKVTVEMFD